MQHRSIAFVLLLLATVGSLAAAPMTFTGFLSGAKESPPNASPGTGFTFVTIDPATHMMRVIVNYADLIGPEITASHIHVINGPGDVDTTDTLGPVATTTPTFPGFPTTTSGTYDQTFDMTLAASYRPGFVTAAGGVAEAEQALFAGIIDGRAYLNIHSTFAPGGEIRDFLAPVPEPATAGLAAIALAGLAIYRRRRSVSL